MADGCIFILYACTYNRVYECACLIGLLRDFYSLFNNMNHLCFFFLSLFVFNCGAEITSSCGKKIVTGTSKDYTQLTYEIMGIDSITFGVAAKNDVHVALDNRFAGLNLDGAAMWEIVLGGWGDTQSVIRDRFAGDNLVSKPSRINSETSFQYFWISWKKYGKNEIISVGTGTTVGVNELMVYHFAASTAIPIGFVHFSTGFGSAGSWDFCNTKFKVPILNSCGSYGFDLFTGYDKNYQQFTAPLVGVTSFVFGVVASNDVHIALDNRILGDNSEGDYMWEIVLGGWGNTQSVIRNRNNGQNLATVMSVYRLLNIATYNYFWVSWANGLLSVGSGVRVGENQIMAFPTVLALLNVPFPIGYVHLSTGYGSPGYWDFCKTVYISTSSTTTSTSTSTTTSTTSTSTTTERPSSMSICFIGS